VIVPTNELPPTTPFTSQMTLWFSEPPTVALNTCVDSISTLGVFGEIDTIITALMVREGDAPFDGSATLCALMKTVGFAGAMTGAVYSPVASIVPHWFCPVPTPVQPPAGPLGANQFTEGLGFEFDPGAGVTVALNWAVVPLSTFDGPLTEKLNRLSIEIEALPDFEGSATLVAVTLTALGFGRIRGAV
jgi:hypothetical protein